ncbi:hypothetical protein CHLRE_04g226950v5 [Chlamydomonas reinhardtii]|uniref:Nas2 N-terminal domain-containing protein n=1 Tax=Chlamydomonas reinhardtii TaxID=3055 RepID=A0A2K3DUP6_CHLRE|nr:uncharacterized protein CHLRE_04g226950v5 [Chlamydomonas reinhardtii]PNW84257.1 hypothetical protein CHLRE_04g226950v5 [Chlamydomonas reinhardtii]
MEEEIADISERLNGPGMPGLKGSLLDKQGFPRSDIDVAAVRRDRHRLICLTNDHRDVSDRLAALLADLHAAMREQAAAAQPSQAAPQPAAAAGAPATTSSAPMDVDGGATAATSSGGEAALATGAAGPAGTAAVAAAAAAAAPLPAAAPSGPALVPFALVDEVSEGSPAASAGLQVGDLLCSFGDVSGAGAREASPGAPPSEQQQQQPQQQQQQVLQLASTAALLQRVAGVLGASEGQAVAATVLRQGAPVVVSLTPQRWSGRGLLGCHLKPL